MQNLWQELPRTQALSSFEFTEYNKINLNDKTTLVNLYDDNINIASISIIVDFSVFDEKDRIGISNFAAEMLKLGTKTKNATQIAAEIEQYGSSLSIYQSQEFIKLHCNALKEHLPAVIAILLDCLQNSNFPIEEIDRLAKQEKAYLLQNQSNVNYLANTAINAVYFDKHPYSKPLSGYSSFFDSINRDELFEWHQQLLSSNKYVILTGNYNFEECKKIIETQLLKSQNEKIETTASSFEFKNSNKLVIIEKEDNSQCIFRLAAPAPERNNEAHPYFQIANTIFGAMFNSRLNTVIREKEGLTYGINSAVLHRRYASQFIISASLKADKAFFAYKLINDELTKIASSDISEDELYRAKNFIIGSFFRSNESQAQKAQFPANIELYHLDQKYYDKYLKSIENATLEQVHHAAKEYFTNNNFAIAICVSKADEYAEFKECFELVYSDAEGNLRT